MKISGFACPSCAASYEVAESTSAEGSPGRAECTICDRLLESWQEPKIKAYRLVLLPEHKYPHFPAPPPPIVSWLQRRARSIPIYPALLALRPPHSTTHIPA